MSYRFSLRQLEYALALADTLNFRAAAERCNVSQPSLSVQLAQLEEAIGVRLFERDRRRVLVTPQGEEVLERARRVLRQADDLEISARRAADPFSGMMKIGVIPTIAPYLLPRVAPALRNDYPGLRLFWSEDRTPELVRLLERGTLDALLVAREAPLGHVDHEVITRDPFVIAATRTHPAVRPGRAAHVSDLRAAKVLLLEDGHCFRDQALAVCSRAKARELEFRATSLRTLVQMIGGGDYVTLLPEMALGIEGAGLKVRRFADPAPYRTIALAWRSGSPLHAAFRRIAATMRAAIRR